MIDITDVEVYFSKHLLKATWEDLSDEVKNASVEMANNDITGALFERELTSNSPLEVGAVSEQAIYLATQSHILTENKSNILSETIDGIGSVDYNPNKSNSKFISNRAKTFIKRRIRELKINNLARG